MNVKDYVIDYTKLPGCKYESEDEAYEDWAKKFIEWLDSDDDSQKPEEYDPEKYGFHGEKRLVGTHKEIQYFYTDRFGKRRRCSDSLRYKAQGNSIAVGYANNQSGFWMTLMKRISAQYERSATLGSLFCGIGGFDLAWATYNGAKNCRWSSEIEPYCIEVCRQHFGDEDTGLEGDIKKYL